MKREKNVTIPDSEAGMSPKRKTDKRSVSALPFHRRIFLGRRSSALRRSIVMRSRGMSTRSGVLPVQRKCRLAQRAVMMMNPHYEGEKLLCHLNLLLQFLFTYLSIWWAKRRISSRVVRKMVVCQIVALIILGFLFTTGGVFNISVTSKSTNEYTKDFYWSMTIVSMVVFALSVMGCIGVFRPNMFITQIYAVVSFIFGHLIFSVVIGWYLLVVLDAYLSDRYFHDSGPSSNNSSPMPLLRNEASNDTTTIAPKEGRILTYRSDEQIYKDQLLRQYCLMLLFTSIIMMSSGVLTTKLLIQVRRKQGYHFVETTQRTALAEPESSTLHSQTLENVLLTRCGGTRSKPLPWRVSWS